MITLNSTEREGSLFVYSRTLAIHFAASKTVNFVLKDEIISTTGYVNL